MSVTSARSGLTLPELAIVLGVGAILAGFAFPRISAMLDRAAVRSAATEVVAAFATARNTAIHRAQRATVLLDSRSAQITVVTGADTVLRRDLARYSVRLSANRQTTTYLPNGLGYGAANLSIVLRRNAAVDTVIVARLGRVRR